MQWISFRTEECHKIRHGIRSIGFQAVNTQISSDITTVSAAWVNLIVVMTIIREIVGHKGCRIILFNPFELNQEVRVGLKTGPIIKVKSFRI
jgi:hypothetical protein